MWSWCEMFEEEEAVATLPGSLIQMLWDTKAGVCQVLPTSVSLTLALPRH